MGIAIMKKLVRQKSIPINNLTANDLRFFGLESKAFGRRRYLVRIDDTPAYRIVRSDKFTDGKYIKDRENSLSLEEVKSFLKNEHLKWNCFVFENPLALNLWLLNEAFNTIHLRPVEKVGSSFQEEETIGVLRSGDFTELGVLDSKSGEKMYVYIHPNRGCTPTYSFRAPTEINFEMPKEESYCNGFYRNLSAKELYELANDPTESFEFYKFSSTVKLIKWLRK